MATLKKKKFHHDFIQEINDRTDIAEIASRYVELKPAGKDLLGCCPFHQESTPSFTVTPSKGLAYCFGCSWGGNAIKFLMELNRISFADAVLDLARSANIPIRYEDGSSEYDYPDPLPRPLKPLAPVAKQEQAPAKDYTVDERRVNQSIQRLLSGTGDAAKALDWLQNRGITREMVRRYRLGLEKRVVTPDQNKPECKEEYWAIAIFIPVPNRPGRFYVKKRVAPWLTGDERPNYLGKWAQFGVPATIWFTYNPPEATETWFCEGEWDAIVLGELARQRGEKVAVCCSTAGAGSLPKQEELRNRLPGEVTTLFDRDEAGAKGAQKLVKALGDRGRIALVPMPDNCSVKGWDVCNALDAGYTWEDFEAAASSAFSYTTSRQELDKNSNRTINRDEWELKFGFGKRLRKRVKQILEEFKGFSKPSAPKPKPDVAPDQLFSDTNQRLQIWQDAVNKGYKYILDASAPGLGKSHAAGIALPEAFGMEKLWYLANNHRNPTTGVIESNYVDLPVRNNGLYIDDSRRTPNGNPFLRWPKPEEEPDTQGNCLKTDLFQKFRAKNLNVEAAEDSPICGPCRLAPLCKNGSGQKYGASFRGDRRNALAHPRIRAHADSMPSPADFDYSASGIIWDEVGTQLKPMDSITVALADFDQVWGELESKNPDLHDQLKPLRLALRPLLTGEAKQPYHGWDDAQIRALLPEKLSNLDAIVAEVEAILQPDLSFLEEKPDSLTADETRGLGVSKAIRGLVNREFRRQAHRDFSEGFERLALNWLVPFLKVWNGERGAFRCEWQKLLIFTKSDRHTSVARAASFNVFLDASIDRARLALLLGIEPSEIYVVGQETPNHGNLRIIQIAGMGKLGKDRRDSLQERVALLKAELKKQFPSVIIGDWQKFTQAGDGQWFVNLRGSNEFQHAPALAVFGKPCPNLGHLQALYQSLTGEYAPLDKENPHEGLQRFIEAHVQAEIEQAVGRLRSHLRPNEQLTFIFVGDYNLSFLGMPVETIAAFELCKAASTPQQKSRWAIWQAYVQLRQQVGDGTEIGSNQLARKIGITKGRLSQIAKDFKGWEGLRRCLGLLFDCLYNNPKHPIEVDEDTYWLAQSYLPLILELPPLEALREVATLIRTQNIEGFKRILAAASLEAKSKLLTAFLAFLPSDEMLTEIEEAFSLDVSNLRCKGGSFCQSS